VPRRVSAITVHDMRHTCATLVAVLDVHPWGGYALLGIAAGLDQVCLPLRRGLGGRDRLTCIFVPQVTRVDSITKHQGTRDRHLS
jgi:hypothetical protein